MMLDLLLPLLRNMSFLAVVALAYGLAMSHLPRWAGPFALAVLCALGALISMFDPIEMRPGVYVDSRSTMVILASFFTGPIGALIAGGSSVAYRIHLGGAGMFAGVAVMMIGAVIGLVGHHLCAQGGRRIRSTHVLILALLSPLCSLGVLALPLPLATEILGTTFVPISISRITGVLLLGLMILHEEWRIDAETEVRRLAYVDELSDLANRRAFYLALNDAWERWERYRSPFTVVMVDIDHFKRINDTYGHPVGDDVICALAEILKAESRATDTAARVGGEEFAVLLVHTESINALRFAERIRERVGVAVITTEKEPLRFTISLGVSQDLARETSRQNVLSSADQALYEAKRNGRNRAVVDTSTAAPDRPLSTLAPTAGRG